MSSGVRDHEENDISPDGDDSPASGTTEKKDDIIAEIPDTEKTPPEDKPLTCNSPKVVLHRPKLRSDSDQAPDEPIVARPIQRRQPPRATQGDSSTKAKNVCERLRDYYAKFGKKIPDIYFKRLSLRDFSLSLGLLVVIIGVIGLYYSDYSGRQLMAIRFTEEIGDIKHRFPTQSKHTWSVLRAAVLGVMNVDKPTHPAVIMLASTIENRDVTHCLAKQLAEIVTKVYDASGHVELSTHLGKSLSPADLKLEFDTTMHRGFSSASKAVVIHDIQKVHGDAAMIFHAFCDNENAPYKDAVLIFTVHLQNESLKENDVDIYLQHIWADHIGLGNADALLSRIGNSVAIVSKEDEEDVTNTC